MSLPDYSKENQNAGIPVSGKCLIDGRWTVPEGHKGTGIGQTSSVSLCGRLTIWQGEESSE